MYITFFNGKPSIQVPAGYEFAGSAGQFIAETKKTDETKKDVVTATQTIESGGDGGVDSGGASVSTGQGIGGTPVGIAIGAIANAIESITNPNPVVSIAEDTLSVDAEGNTYWSVNPEEFTPLLATAPSITGALPENEGAIITWAVAENQSDAIPSLGVVHWKIGYKPEASGGDYTWVESTNPLPTYELTGLTNGTKYAIAVIDVVNGVDSEPSQPFYVTPSAT